MLYQAGQAQADTSVGGAVTADTVWAAANSPYVVTQDVVVQGGAQLKIEAGTVIYMGAGTSLSVNGGAVVAAGTTAASITVTSAKAMPGAAGATAGDWLNWNFNASTQASALNHIVFNYGSGIKVNGSAPVFNYLDIRNQAGPAISQDLAASPTGVGNQASNNTLNVVQVPAGDITGSVTWGIRGIPYLVTGAGVSVGQSPQISQVSPQQVQQGDSVLVTLSGSRLKGASVLNTSNTGISTALQPGDDGHALAQVTVANNAPIGNVDLSLLVDAGTVAVPAGLSVIRPITVLSSIQPSTVFTGQGPTSITLTGSKIPTNADLNINGAITPATVFSSTQMQFSVPGQTAAGTLPISIRKPDPDHPGQYIFSNALPLTIAVAALQLTGPSLVSGEGTPFNLTLTAPLPAPAGGFAVNLTSSAPSVASVPATISIPAGATTTTLALQTLAAGSTTITASAPNYSSATALLAVDPQALVHLSLDEASGNALDSSGNHHDATVVGNPGRLQPPLMQTSQYSMNFSASGYLTQANAAWMNGDQQTIEMWVRWSSSPGGVGTVLVDRTQPAFAYSQGGPFLHLCANSATTFCLQWLNKSSPESYYIGLSTPDISWVNKSYYFVITQDYINDAASIYVDGQLMATQHGIGPKPSNPGDLWWGNRKDAFWTSFGGNMDELAIYPHILSADEILARYKKGIGQP